jgi:hypothetical protein
VEKLAGGEDNGSPAVKVWSTRNKEVLWSSSRRLLGRRKSGAVDGQRALTEDVGVGEKWSPGVISHRFELDGASAPSADEGGAVHRLR